jgi:hypothetical protein
MMDVKNILPPKIYIQKKQAAYIVFFFSAVVFLFHPSTLYLFNIADWHSNYLLLMPFISFGVLTFTLLFCLYLSINLINKYLASYCVYLLCCLSFIILLNDLLSPVQLGYLIGVNLHIKDAVSEEPTINTIIEIVIAVVVMLSCFFILKHNKQKLYFYMNTFTALSIIMICTAVLISMPQQTLHQRDISTTAKNSLPNIYLLHLDAMQTDYFLHYLHHQDAYKDFTGFTVYEKNIANYQNTVESVISYLTSSTYKGASNFKSWQHSVSDGLAKSLNVAGYTTRVASLDQQENISFEQSLSYFPMEALNFLPLWLIKLVPNFLTNEVLIWSIEWAREEVSKDITRDSIADKRFTISYLRTDEVNQPQAGLFTYAVVKLPHHRYTLNEKCLPVNTGELYGSEAYYKQVVCVMRQTIDYLNELKKIQRYDNSIIIILGDHGSHGTGQLIDYRSQSFDTDFNPSRLVIDDADKLPAFDPDISPMPFPSIEAHARALLMIKPIESKKDLIISQKLTQLLDVYPTIMGQLPITPLKNNLEGIDIINKNVSDNRKRYMHLLDHRADKTFGMLPSSYHSFMPTYTYTGLLRLQHVQYVTTENNKRIIRQ